MSFKEPEGQVARWLQRCQEYDFGVEHRPWKSDAKAGALSRKTRGKHGSILRWDGICAVTLLENKRGGKHLSRWKASFCGQMRLQGHNVKTPISSIVTQIHKSKKEDPYSQRTNCKPIQSPYQSNIQQYPLLELKDNVLKLKPEDKQKNFKPRVILRTFLVQPALRRLLDGLKGSHLGCHKTLCKVQARLWRPGPASAVKV